MSTASVVAVVRLVITGGATAANMAVTVGKSLHELQ